MRSLRRRPTPFGSGSMPSFSSSGCTPRSRPMPAVISRIERFHRIQIIVQTPDAGAMRRLFSVLRADRPIRPAVKIAVDIDPVNCYNLHSFFCDGIVLSLTTGA